MVSLEFLGVFVMVLYYLSNVISFNYVLEFVYFWGIFLVLKGISLWIWLVILFIFLDMWYEDIYLMVFVYDV